MRHKIVLLYLIIFLTSCVQVSTQQVSPSAIPTRKAKSTSTPTITLSSTPKPPTVTSQPTSTPHPTPRPVLIKLSQGHGDGIDWFHICLYIYDPYPQFILYEDGQLVYLDDGSFYETKLTDAEMNDLLGKIEATGYLKLGDSIEEHYAFPKDYVMPDNVWGSGWGQAVSVRGKGVSINPDFSKYLLKPIKDTINIIERYQPTGEIKEYTSETLTLYEDGSFPTPSPIETALAWPTEFPRLGFDTPAELSKSETAKLLKSNLFTSLPGYALFRQDGIDYYVSACPPLDW
jgi:hypothetical protein